MLLLLAYYAASAIKACHTNETFTKFMLADVWFPTSMFIVSYLHSRLQSSLSAIVYILHRILDYLIETTVLMGGLVVHNGQ